MTAPQRQREPLEYASPESQRRQPRAVRRDVFAALGSMSVAVGAMLMWPGLRWVRYQYMIDDADFTRVMVLMSIGFAIFAAGIRWIYLAIRGVRRLIAKGRLPHPCAGSRRASLCLRYPRLQPPP